MCASTPSILNPTISTTHYIDSLSTLTIPSLYEVNYLLMKSHCTSPTDPLSLSLYNTLSHLFSPNCMDIIANSLNSGQVLSCIKTVIISSILKKNLDSNSLRNNRPIFHIPLLSKIFERIVSKQLIEHIRPIADLIKKFPLRTYYNVESTYNNTILYILIIYIYIYINITPE